MPPIIFALLNPSTATAETDDPTIRRCIGYARRWGYGALIVVNLFAIRSPNPKLLYSLDDPVGPENMDYWDKAIYEARQDSGHIGTGYEAPVLCGWGVHGGYLDQDNRVLRWLERKPARPLALGVTKKNFPRHPLYMWKDAKPTKYLGR